GVRADRLGQGLRAAEVNELEARRERSEVLAILRLAREADDRRRAPMEVVTAYDDLGLVARHALHAIAPLARELDRRLDRLGAGVHRQRHVHLRRVAELLEELAHPVVVHGPRRQREPAGLREQRLEDARVAMALVQ